MSKKQTYIWRYLELLRILKNSASSSFPELHDALRERMENQIDTSIELPEYSLRTFQRDIKEIEKIFGVTIQYSHAEKGYFIAEEVSKVVNQNMLQMIEMKQLLNRYENTEDIVQFENRKVQGMEHFSKLLQAIKNKKVTQMRYHKFGGPQKQYTLEPYLLKEYRNRWYVLTKDQDSGRLKTFALDRILEISTLGEQFEVPNDLDIENYFQHYFGVTKLDQEKVQKIVLQFSKWQSYYIKTLPLHHSQKTIEETDDYLKIELNLCPTYEFLMELRSFGKECMVLEPYPLQLKIYNELTETLNNYDHL